MDWHAGQGAEWVSDAKWVFDAGHAAPATSESVHIRWRKCGCEPCKIVRVVSQPARWSGCPGAAPIATLRACLLSSAVSWNTVCNHSALALLRLRREN